MEPSKYEICCAGVAEACEIVDAFLDSPTAFYSGLRTAIRRLFCCITRYNLKPLTLKLCYRGDPAWPAASLKEEGL